MKKLAIATLLLCACRVFATAPALTTVTATLQDSSGQVWSNATWSTIFVPPFGNPSPPNNNGHPISANQSGTTDAVGFFSVNLDDNNVVAPAGSKWRFIICPNASVTSCLEIQLIVTGGSLDLSSSLNSLLTVPVVSALPSIARAYRDSEVSGSYGVFYVNSVDNTLRQCQILFCSGTGWAVITVTTNNPIFTGTLTVPCVKFDTTIPTDDTTVCGQALTGHINITLPAVTGTLALLASPAFTGVPTAPTAAPGTNTTQLATTAFVTSAVASSPVTSVFGRTGAVVAVTNDYSVAQVNGAAPLASPTFTGVPAAPTAAPGTNTTQIATTAFVQAASASAGGILAQSNTTCTGCPVTVGNSLTTVISKAVTFPSSGCPCRIYASYSLYMTTGASGVDGALVSDGTDNWAVSNNNTTGSVGAGATYGLNASGYSPSTYTNGASKTFTVKSANSHAGNATANLNIGSDITPTFPDSSLNLVIYSSQ